MSYLAPSIDLGDFPLWTTQGDSEQRLLAGLTTLNHERECDIAVDGEVRHTLLHDLFSSPQVASVLRGRRLLLRGVVLREPLDLSFTRVPFPVSMVEWSANDVIRLHHAQFVHFTIRGGSFTSIEANGARFAGDLHLGDGATFLGRLSFDRARVRGSIRFRSIHVRPREGFAFSANDAIVGGALDMDGSRFRGGVSLRNLHVRGDLRGARAWFKGDARLVASGKRRPLERSLAFDGALMRVGGSFSMWGAHACGEVSVMNAVCRGNIIFNEASLRVLSGDVLSIDHARVGGSVFFRGFKAHGNVRLPGTEIGLDLEFRRAVINGGSAHASRSSADSAGSPATVEEETPALSANRMQLHGSFLLYDVTATGPVSLEGSRIDGSLVCHDVELAAYWPAPVGATRGRCCLRSGGAAIRGDVDLARVRANALFDFHSLRAMNLTLRFVDFAEESVTGILLDNARIRGECALIRIPPKPGSKLVLSHASIGSLRHGRESWPPQMQLNGCRYGTIGFAEPSHPGATTDASMDTGKNGRVTAIARGIVRLFWGRSPRPESLDWLAKHHSPQFQAQPYEQLSSVMLQSGDDDEAKQIQIELENERLRGADPAAIALGRMRGWLLEHGHSTRRLWVLGTAWVMVAALLLGQAKAAAVMRVAHEDMFLDSAFRQTGTVPPEYPAFNAVVYALDAFLPLVDLHQEGYWMPDRGVACVLGSVRIRACGALFRLFFWTHVLVGWVTTTLLVISVTGMIRRAPAE